MQLLFYVYVQLKMNNKVIYELYFLIKPLKWENMQRVEVDLICSYTTYLVLIINERNVLINI